MEKLNKNVSLQSARNCTEYLHGRNSAESPLLTREPLSRVKVRKTLNPSEGSQAERELPATAPYLFKEHPAEKK
jgi:hypothetical protein